MGSIILFFLWFFMICINIKVYVVIIIKIYIGNYCINFFIFRLKDDFVISERSCKCMFIYFDIYNIVVEAIILRRVR